MTLEKSRSYFFFFATFFLAFFATFFLAFFLFFAISLLLLTGPLFGVGPHQTPNSNSLHF